MSTRTVWLSRDEAVRHPTPEYELWDYEPERSRGVWDNSYGNVFCFCRDDFERFSAIRLQPGECVEVEFRDPFTRREEGSVTL
jgi:hypothetical protein